MNVLPLPGDTPGGPRGWVIQEPRHLVTVEGVPLPEAVTNAIVSLSVTQVANQPASFSLQLDDPHMVLIDAHLGLFAEGRKIAILMGYGNDLQNLIEGEVSAVSIEIDSHKGTLLTVEGFDHLHGGSRGVAYREFRDAQTDSAIVQQIAQEMGLLAVVDPTGVQSDRRVQAHVSNLSYLQALAQAHDFQLWAEGGTLHFQRVRAAGEVLLLYGDNLETFSARLSTAGHVRDIEVRGWDAGNKQAISATASVTLSAAYAASLSLTGQSQIGSDSKEVIFADGEVRSIAEAQRLAEARMSVQRRNLLSAEGRTFGNPALRVGSVATVKGLARFSGQYVVEQARHTMADGGYSTSFELRQQL